MTQKLLLAEGLDLMRRTEAREYEVDRTQSRMSSRSAYRQELSHLVEAYASVYTDYLRAAEIINHVRRCAKESGDAHGGSLIAFCEGKMRACMDRCELVRRKEDNILLPLEQIDAVGKDRYQVGEPVFVLSGAQFVLKRKEPFAREETLTDGSYLLVVRNLDDYAVAAPLLRVGVDILPQRGRHVRLEKTIPQRCGWRRVIGVVGAATVKLRAHTDAVLRNSRVDVSLHRLSVKAETSMADAEARSDRVIGQLPKLTDDELTLLANSNVPAGELPPPNHQQHNNHSNHSSDGIGGNGDTMAALCALNVPHRAQSHGASMGVPPPIAVNATGATCGERLAALRQTLNAWPNEGVMAVPLSREQQHVMQAIFGLPFPTEIAD